MSRSGFVPMLVLLPIFMGACSKPHPPIPPEVLSVQCDADKEYRIVSEGYEIFRLGGTTLVAPCREQGSFHVLEKIWRMEVNQYSPISKVVDILSFIKSPDGHFVVSKLASPSPWSKRAKYSVLVTVRPDDPMLKKNDFHRDAADVTVPTPPAFKATGPATTFWCTGKRYVYYVDGYWCTASVKSNDLYWVIRVIHGKPAADDIDMRPIVSEAYNQLALHILAQE